MITLLSHFYNEEYLLPFWIEHHKKIFENAVLVDYDSTDKSLEIIKELAPSSWKVIQSENKLFNAQLVDNEILKLELPIDGYKICLNTTEFMLLEEYNNIDKIFTEDVYQLQKCRLYDKDNSIDPNTLKELLSNINYGYFANDYRFLHKLNNGYSYTCGRHNFYSDHTLNNTDKAIILHFEYYPWNKRFIDRKIQIKNKLPKDYNGAGSHHMRNFEQTNNDKISGSSQCEDLSKNNYFQKFLKSSI
jgi:hypothetical protein